MSVCSGHPPQAAHTGTEPLSIMVCTNPASGTDHSEGNQCSPYLVLYAHKASRLTATNSF